MGQGHKPGYKSRTKNQESRIPFNGCRSRGDNVPMIVIQVGFRLRVMFSHTWVPASEGKVMDRPCDPVVCFPQFHPSILVL